MCLRGGTPKYDVYDRCLIFFFFFKKDNLSLLEAQPISKGNFLMLEGFKLKLCEKKKKGFVNHDCF